MALSEHSQEIVLSAQEVYSEIQFACIQIEGLSGGTANIHFCPEIGAER